jgi:hypothetical protein
MAEPANLMTGNRRTRDNITHRAPTGVEPGEPANPMTALAVQHPAQ